MPIADTLGVAAQSLGKLFILTILDLVCVLDASAPYDETPRSYHQPDIFWYVREGWWFYIRNIVCKLRTSYISSDLGQSPSYRTKDYCSGNDVDRPVSSFVKFRCVGRMIYLLESRCALDR